MWRSRWAAIGAAVAVSLGAGGLFVAQAAPGPAESTVVTVTPERILDTRDPVNLGLAGPFTSPVAQKLQVTGSIPTATGTKVVVPAGATGVLLNVTPVNMTANGFISIRPGDATGAATTSSLNFTTGVAGVVPNAVQVAMPTAGANAGQIDITYDAYGQAGQTTDILVDVVGYLTNTGLQELVADVATKANAADVYTKAQIDGKFATTGSQVLGAASFTANTQTTWVNGCIRESGGDNTVRSAVQLPVGVTITSVSARVVDSNAAAGQVRLFRLTTTVPAIASVSTVGTPGLHTVTATLATPELVSAGEYFFVEYEGGDGTPLHQICGVSVSYTIPVGQSVLLEDVSGDVIAGPTAGSE